MSNLIFYIVEFVRQTGYLGIFFMTCLESTFIPLPAEITMVPAGYLVSKGSLNFALVFLASISGTMAGSYINYWIALHYGRHLITNYGKYLFLKPDKLKHIEAYFEEHGKISTFTGRLIPGLRHYISFPAGLAKMNLALFMFYTGLGGGIWMLCLITLGYFIGNNEDLVHKYIVNIQIALAVVVITMISIYTYLHMKKRKAKKNLKS